VEVLADSALPTGRRLRLLVRATRPAVVSLRLQWLRTARLVRVAGQVVPPPAEAKSPAPTGAYATLLYYAPGAAGVQLEIETAGPGAFELIAVDRSLGLPAVPGIQPLPATMIPAPGYNSFTTQVKKGVNL
jgi:hypothetical protein